MRKRDPLIYALIDPEHNEVRYIGQSVYGLTRARSHMWASNLQKGYTPSDSWVRKLLRKGLTPTIEIVERCDESALDERETWWITFGRLWGCRLTNRSSGGKNGSGWKHSPETKRKITVIQNRPEVKAKIKATMSIPENKKRHSQAVKKALANPEVKQKQRLGVIEAHKRPEVKEKHRLGLIARHAKPENQEKRKVTDANPEVKAKRSASQIKAHGTPEARLRASLAMNNPETKIRHSAAVAETWKDPDVKLRRSVAISAALSCPGTKSRQRAGMRAAWVKRRQIHPGAVALDRVDPLNCIKKT